MFWNNASNRSLPGCKRSTKIDNFRQNYKFFVEPELWFLARFNSFRYAVGRKGVETVIVKFNADRLKEVREQKNISQMRLAELCDSSDRYIRALELGNRENPSAVLVCLLSYVLDLTMEELMIIKQEGEQQE